MHLARFPRVKLFPAPTPLHRLENLTRELGLEYAQMGINVNAICPGFYITHLADNAYDHPEFVQAVSAFTPMGRCAMPDELKGAAIFLASAASDYMCGQMIITDGGICAK